MAFIEAMRRFSVFSTSNVDEAETLLCKSLVDARVMKVLQRDKFGFHLNRFDLPTVSFISNSYESYTEIESGESGIHDNTIHFIFGGSIVSEFSVNDMSLPVSQTKGVVLAPEKKIRVRRNPGSEILIMRINQWRLNDYLELLLDQELSSDVEFQPDVDLTKGAGAFLKRLAMNLLCEIQQGGSLIRNESISRNLDELFLGGLLQLANNTETLAKDTSTNVAPGIVIRAEEYIREHLSESITISDLLIVCGCSRTTLYSCFKSARGYTPKEFLLEQRLQKARQEISRSTPEETIATVALNCGFSHLGRFSQYYRKRFGELPSATLR